MPRSATSARDLESRLDRRSTRAQPARSAQPPDRRRADAAALARLCRRHRAEAGARLHGGGRSQAPGAPQRAALDDAAAMWSRGEWRSSATRNAQGRRSREASTSAIAYDRLAFILRAIAGRTRFPATRSRCSTTRRARPATPTGRCWGARSVSMLRDAGESHAFGRRARGSLGARRRLGSADRRRAAPGRLRADGTARDARLRSCSVARARRVARTPPARPGTTWARCKLLDGTAPAEAWSTRR